MAEKMSDEANQSIKLCEPCAESKKSESATRYCPKCEELLCADCTAAHGTRKATKTHALVPVEEMEAAYNKEGVLNESISLSKCEPCDEDGKSSIAKLFCEQCKAQLCEACAHSHKLQKIAKSHELINIEDMLPPGKTCEPCKEDGTSISATKYCRLCDEYMCHSCTRVHKTQKATKSHTLVNIDDIVSDNVLMCKQCLNNGNNSTAVLVCVQCKECICDDCCKRHKSQKATRSHQLISTDKIPKYEPSQCDVCDDNQYKKATNFCKECNENLCENCVAIHKSFKGHTITTPTDPLDQFIKQIRLCEPCTKTGNCNFAVKLCMQCKENFCQECCAFHSKQTAPKAHQFLDFTEDGPKDPCDPCINRQKVVSADKFCKECDEYLCDTCYNHHTAQKQTQNHTVVNAAEQLDKTEIAVCEVCKRQDQIVMATSYCVDCEEPELLCDSCAQQHKAQKLFQSHKLTNDIAAFHDVNDEKKPSKDTDQFARSDMTGAKEVEQVAVIPKIPADLPGKPSALDIKADSLSLRWNKPEHFDKGEIYQIRYKDLDSSGSKWTFHPSQPSTASVTLSDMKAKTKFVFQVRVIHEDGEEGPHSLESDPITTLESPAAKLVPFSEKLPKRGSPSLYELPKTENIDAKNIKAQSKKFDVVTPSYDNTGERIIMLVGATGTGKTTLVNGIVNYAFGVNWNDPFRFTVIDEKAEKLVKEKNQADSQTEWITCYTLNPEPGSRIPYKLTVIDTPGFGDTRGIQRDNQIVNQIRQLFSEKGQKGVLFLDAVCFLVKAPDARLTHTQTYVFESIMSLFGNNIENNICSLVTFADGMDPPVLAALNKSNLPFGKHFEFNNSALFAQNVGLETSSLSPMFWDMGCNSFRAFFDHLGTMQKQSLQLTKEVLEERHKLEETVKSLQPQIAAGLSKIDELKTERKVIERHKTDIKANKNFEYEVSETRQTVTELERGVHVTNCLHCHITCHRKCIYANDSEKIKCSSMDANGNCKICPDKCCWDQHANTPYILGYESVTVKKTYAEKLNIYKRAGEKVLSHQQVVQRMTEELDELENKIGSLVVTVKECNEILKEIALRPNPLSMVEHIDTMIEAESHEQKEGYKSRIDVLREYRRKAEIGKDIDRFDQARKDVHGERDVSAATPKEKATWKVVWDRLFNS